MACPAASGGRPDLEHPPGLVHLVEREPVEGGQELQRRLAELRRPLDDERAGAAAGGDDAHRLQRPQARAERGAADAHRLGQLPLGRKLLAGPEAPGLDLPADVLDDLGAGRGVTGHQCGPTSCRGCATNAMTNTTPDSASQWQIVEAIPTPVRLWSDHMDVHRRVG